MASGSGDRVRSVALTTGRGGKPSLTPALHTQGEGGNRQFQSPQVGKLTTGRTDPRSGKRSATRQNSGHPLASPHPVFSVDQRFAIEKALDHTLRHKRRPIGHMGDDVGIVAHQQIGHAVLLFQAVKQIENFRLH